MAKAVSRLEEELRQQEEEKAAVLNDLSSLRELCIKLDSGKDIMTQQLNSKSLELERVRTWKIAFWHSAYFVLLSLFYLTLHCLCICPPSEQ